LGRDNDYDKNDVAVGCGQGGPQQQQQQHSFITRSVNNYSNNDEEQEEEENGGNNAMTIPTTTKTPITTKVKRWFTSSITGNDENNDKAGNVGYVASLDDVDGRYDDDNYSSNNKNNNSNDNNNIAVVVDNDNFSVSLVCSNYDNGDD
jgi:hypothetical protein